MVEQAIDDLIRLHFKFWKNFGCLTSMDINSHGISDILMIEREMTKTYFKI